MALRAVSRQKNFRFEQGRHDVRGWEVRTRVDEEKVGRVDDLLIDENDRTRYLDLELSSRRQHVLLPPGQARIDTSAKVVWVPGFSKGSFADVPAYAHDPATVDADYERRLSTAYDSAYSGDQHYERPDYRTTWSRGRSDTTAGHLGRLDELDDYEVASDEDDPRGWKVVGSDGSALGKVDHLIGDTSIMKVRYLEMKLDRGVGDRERNVLLPAAHVALDGDERHVRVDALDAERATTLPAYDGGTLGRRHEMRVLQFFSDAYTDGRRYSHPRYRDEHLHGERTGRHQTGGVGEHVDVGTRGDVEADRTRRRSR